MESNLRRITPLIVLAFALVLLAGCAGSGEYNVDQDQQPVGIVKPEPVEHTAAASLESERCSLIVGDFSLVGTCEVYNESGYLHFDFESDPTWKITGVKVYAGSDPPGETPSYSTGFELTPAPATELDAEALISDETVTGVAVGTLTPRPLPSGLALPLPYSRDDVTPTNSLSLVFSLDGISGASLFLMASATVERGIEVREAMVRSPQFPGQDVIEYSMAPEFRVPEGDILTYLSYGTSSTYVTTFYDCPVGYDVSPNMPYLGWCVDLAHVIQPNKMHTMQLFSSLDRDLPEDLADADWDMVNYVINHKQGNRGAVQSAIWYFVGGGAYPENADAVAMVEDALANGEGFSPAPYESLMVIVHPEEPTQTTGVEVEVPDWTIHEY